MTSAVLSSTSLRRRGRHDRPESLGEFVRASGLQSLVVGTSKDPNAKITVLLVSPVSRRPVLALKAPTTDTAARAIEAEERALLTIRQIAPRSVIDAIPRVVDAAEFDGRHATVLTAVPGIPMTTSYMRRRHTATEALVAADFGAVETWLGDLQSGTAGETMPLDMDGGVAVRLRCRFPDDELLEADLERLAEINSRLGRSEIPRTAVHGDLWLGNLLLTGGQISGVVDWEAATASGEPVRDLVRFALMYALYLDRRTRPGRRVAGHSGLRADRWGAGVEFALDGAGWFPDLFRRFLERGLTRLGAPAANWRDAAVAGIAEVAAHTDDGDYARRHLDLFRRVYGPGQLRNDT